MIGPRARAAAAEEPAAPQLAAETLPAEPRRTRAPPEPVTPVQPPTPPRPGPTQRNRRATAKFVSPVVARIAAEHGVDPSRVRAPAAAAA